MKIFKVLGYYGLGLVILFSCQKPTIIESVISPSFSSAVFIYMIADNNLSFYATRDINEMEAGLKPEDSGKVFVFVDKGLYSKPSHPYILSIVPEKYFVRVYNKYFEPLDSIWVDTFFFGKIPSMTTSDYKRLPSGDLSFSAITRSGLKLKALLHLTGSVEILIVHINENGNISLLQERE